MTSEAQSDEGWRRCSGCKAWIDFAADYYVCNVSTCRRKNTNFAFCSVTCWDAHVPTMNHRESWAEEAKAPTRAQAANQSAAGPSTPRLKSAKSAPAPSGGTTLLRKSGGNVSRPPAPRQPSPEEKHVLIVTSRLKQYIKDTSGLSTSDGVLEPLSDIVRAICDEAVKAARRDERKTLLARDIPKRS